MVDLDFPHSLPEFQRLFPDDAACFAYLELARWREGFICPYCSVKAKLSGLSVGRGLYAAAIVNAMLR